jgi:hypothetical protein
MSVVAHDHDINGYYFIEYFVYSLFQGYGEPQGEGRALRPRVPL